MNRESPNSPSDESISYGHNEMQYPEVDDMALHSGSHPGSSNIEQAKEMTRNASFGSHPGSSTPERQGKEMTPEEKAKATLIKKPKGDSEWHFGQNIECWRQYLTSRKLRTRWTTGSNSVVQQNLIGYQIANLKLNLRGEKESKIHIPSWNLHFVFHFCPQV